MRIEGRDDEFRGTITAIFQDETGRDATPNEMAVYLDACQKGMTGPELRAIIHAYDEAIAYRNKPIVPPPSPVPDLTPKGIYFAQPLVGTDQFCALRMVLDGRINELDALIHESTSLGFNLWRVFGQGSKAQNGILDLKPSEANYYGDLNTLAQRLNRAGIVLLFTAYVDNQDIQSDASHWQHVGEALKGTASLVSGGNEWSKNGFDPKTLTPLDGLLWSRGSDVGDGMPFDPPGSFMEFHPVRTFETALRDTVASPVFIYGRRPFIPLIIDEPPRMGTDGSGPQYADPWNCYKFARHYFTECAGAVFHSRAGIASVPMDPLTAACAREFVRGSK